MRITDSRNYRKEKWKLFFFFSSVLLAWGGKVKKLPNTVYTICKRHAHTHIHTRAGEHWRCPPRLRTLSEV